MELHPYQLSILCSLTFCDSKIFSDLNEHKLPTDQFNYHLQKLVKVKLIDKKQDGNYILTNEGKRFIESLNYEKAQIEAQPKTYVIPLCIDLKGRVLIQKRKKHPFYDYYGLPAGKVRYGSLLRDEAIRILQEETGLTGFDPLLKEIKHIVKEDPDLKNIWADGIFYIFHMQSFEGDLHNTKNGENYWMTQDEISQINEIFSDTLQSIKSVFGKSISFYEEVHDYRNL